MKLFALVLAISSIIVFVANNYIVKSQNLDSVDVLFVRSILQTILLFPVAKITGHQLWPKSGNSRNQSWLIRSVMIFASITGKNIWVVR